MKGHGGTGDERHVSEPWPNSPPLCAGCGMPVTGRVVWCAAAGTHYHPGCNPWRAGTVDRPLVPGEMPLSYHEQREWLLAASDTPATIVDRIEADLARLRRLVARGC